ncbi:hypothetical protein [Streptomyces sp. NPDC086776]|uniref:hypothetical protein n=1 Tax=Streptomyces sp. NPDC086776 TaxID=3365756 RepID=UPI00380F1B9C
MVDQTGAREVGGDGVLYQYMDQSMKDTAAWNKNTSNTMVGDFRWENYKASVDVSFPDPDGGPAALGERQQKGMAISDAADNLRIGPDGASEVDTAPIRRALAEVAAPEQGAYTAASWDVFGHAVAAAKSAVAGQEGLDTVGVEQLASRL